MSELPLLQTIERIARRHIPLCFAVERVYFTDMPLSSGNPAPFEIVIEIRRLTEEPEPAGWGYTLGQEIRAGWDRSEFRLRVQHVGRK
jgi:hypothetical protein